MNTFVNSMLTVAAVCGIAVSPALAATIPAFNNAEIRVAGVDSTDDVGDASGIRIFNGVTSTLFFNAEGSNNFPFEVFAVADFALPAEPLATDVVNSSLTIYEAPASFAVPGPINVYLAGNTSANLLDATANPAAGVPSFQSGSSGLAAIDPAFAPFSTLLGTGNFLASGIPGTPTVIPLSLSGPELADALAAVNSGGTLRLIVAPGNPTVAFTGAGQGNSSGAPPTLSYDTVSVPEPATLTLLMVGMFAGGSMLNPRRSSSSLSARR
jgi:PEP-CTERM motif